MAGSLISQFDDLVGQLSASSEVAVVGDIGPCFFCGNNATKLLCHDDKGCRIPVCLSCGEPIVEIVQALAEIIARPVEDQDWATEYQQVQGYLDEDNWYCRICSDHVHFSTVRLEDPTDDDVL